MARTWASDVVSRAIVALAPKADAVHAAGAFEYMQHVAPFLGVRATDRRWALATAWLDLPLPTSDQLGKAAQALLRQPEREYHYAAYDLIEKYPAIPNEHFLEKYGADLLTTKPWWDTVDGFVNTMVSPLMRRFHDDDRMDAWSASGDRWLIRAAIGHQRGWKTDTDVPRVLQLCDAHWNAREFYIAKAIGWAMRDIARLDPDAIRAFLETHDTGNRVAVREAEKGLGVRGRPVLVG